jgi:hypothetical protein
MADDKITTKSEALLTLGHLAGQFQASNTTIGGEEVFIGRKKEILGILSDLSSFVSRFPETLIDQKDGRLVVEFNNLTEAQALALEDLFAVWKMLSGMGGSRWTAFMADGDGNFHPSIKVNGRDPHTFGDAKKRWHVAFYRSKGIPKSTSNPGVEPGSVQSLGETYLLDFDEIAWRLRSEREQRQGQQNESKGSSDTIQPSPDMQQPAPSPESGSGDVPTSTQG